eukprot:TRINITY_DN15667_c0_g1_i4.p1 TRINITY_DN15667_c0_g1~~TRINITY_DN15667_c0_g1_i4.p1  ORF type:complete len:475 (-),score=83.63 TRINITY_DN15667_c0_g1_i4:269-1693(-)
MKSLLIQFVLLMIPLLALGLPYDSIEDLYSPEYDYDEDNEVSEEGDVMKAPGFVSETMNLVVNEGETIRLPCIVTRLQGFVLLWKKNDNIITVGDQILGNADSRYYLEAKENGNNLMISLAEPGDEGEFVCQVSAFKPTQIHHSVKIRVRPSIQTSPVKTLTVKEGEEARLYCRVVAGNPKPKLKWRRKGGIMPTGDEEIMGEVIIFESVTRHYEGTYECVTEDDYGFEPITREVQLHVEYAPVIEQEQTYIKTEAGEEIHVTCVVHAYPEPQVEWEKDGQPIDEHSDGFVINRSGDRHNLILLVVKKEFFGDYSCRAGNELGVATKSAHVSAYAEEAQIRKTPLKSSPQSLQIEWTAQSETPITIFRVQFMANDSTDWSEVDVTASKLENDDWYGKANLMNLQPNTEYMVKVSSMNNEGYSQFSGVQLFATPAKGQVKQEAISSSSSAQITVNLLLYLIPLMSSLISGKVFIK